MNKRKKRPPSAMLKVVRTEVFRQRVVEAKTRYCRKPKHSKLREDWSKPFLAA
jgi:stalled ribosome alternative rescue factor ArfA